MKVTRRCQICRKTKTLGVGHFTKLKNLLGRLDRQQVNRVFSSKKIKPDPEGYVCSRCSGDLLKKYPRKTEKEN